MIIKSFLAAAVVAASLVVSSAANATLIDFRLAWSGASFGNNATATGTITIDDAVLLNPSDGYYQAEPALLGITAFSITVSGAAVGNGTFTLEDFNDFAWWTDGVALDLSQELIGQPTTNGVWGTSDASGGCMSEGCGDFNIFPNQGSGAPGGTYFFEITTNEDPEDGSGDRLLLTSFAPVQVAEPTALSLFGLGLLGLGLAARRRKT